MDYILSVVTLAAAARRTPLDTFTIGFPGEADERGPAAVVATMIGARHRAAVGTTDYLGAAREIARIFGEMSADRN